jgi:hypothetical protein
VHCLIALAGVLAAAGSVSASEEAKAGEGAVLRVQIVGSAGTTEGMCFLVHQERREHDVVHYFLTSSHLFDAGSLGESRTVPLRIRVIVDDSTVIETSGNNVSFPGGIEQGLGLAIIKAVSTNTSLAPTPVAMDPPDAGGVFVVWRRQGDGSKAMLTERVRFRSTRLVIGDRAAADANGFLGSPAAVEGGVFGVVSEVGSGGAPVIALLSAARGFLTRAIPGWTPTVSTTPGFRLEQRVVQGPLLQVGCDAVKAGDLDVPIAFAPREVAVDATADFTSPRALRLGDITVLSLQDEVVKLRFTMMGVPPPPFPAPCPQGQALVTIGVNVVVVPRR